MPDLVRRIQFLKENIRLHELMSHFGHRYRLNGNMICPFHEETNPSSRLYDDQDTFWCFVCSPDRGVDLIEYVLLEQGYEADHSRGRSLVKACEYLEEAFGLTYSEEDWEKRLEEALYPIRRSRNPSRYWHTQHRELLISMLSQGNGKWAAYSSVLRALLPAQSLPSAVQAPLWQQAREKVCG